MGFLSEVFTSYYNSNDNKYKEKLKDQFKSLVWGALPYTKLNRFFKYRVSYDRINNKKDIEILEEYQCVEYRILKSRYNINDLNKEDLVKARINSNYGKYFDKDIYYKKEYYKAMAQYRNIYFNYLNGESLDLEDEVNRNSILVNQLKEESLDNKLNMSWDDYKSFINMCFDKVFNNYRPIDDKIENDEFTPNNILDWDEDNYILGYINKSLNGYLRNYLNELKGNRKKKNYKICECCGRLIEWSNNKIKYCKLCAKTIKNEQNKGYYHKNLGK